MHSFGSQAVAELLNKINLPSEKEESKFTKLRKKIRFERIKALKEQKIPGPPTGERFL